MTSRDTGAGTPLDAAWNELLLDACASDGPIRDNDVRQAIRRHRAEIEAAARSRPATDPAGLDVPRLRQAMRWRRVEHKDGDHTAVPPTPEEVAIEYARLFVADGPGPEERLHEAAMQLARAVHNGAEQKVIDREAWTVREMLGDRAALERHAALPEHREETGR